MEDLTKYHEIGSSFIDRLKLITYPVAVKMIGPEEEVPEAAIQPSLVFGAEVPAAGVYLLPPDRGLVFSDQRRYRLQAHRSLFRIGRALRPGRFISGLGRTCRV